MYKGHIVSGKKILTVFDLHIGINSMNQSMHVLRGVDFCLERNSQTAIMGETGCGKSVLAMSVFRLLPKNAAVAGHITLFENVDLLTVPSKVMRGLRGTSMVLLPQSPLSHLNPVFTVGVHLNETIRRQKKLPVRTIRNQALELIEKAGVKDPVSVYNAYPHQLSGGMAQRALLSIGLAGNPALLIADEPTKGLDADARDHYLNLTQTLFHKSALLIITHDLTVAASCERVIIMYAGRIVEDGPASEVLRYPEHPYTKGLIGAHPDNGLHPIAGSPSSPGDSEKGCAFYPRCNLKTDKCLITFPDGIKKGLVTVWCHHA